MMIQQSGNAAITLSSIQAWIAIAGGLITWVISMFVMIRTSGRKEAELHAAIADNKKDINAVGERVNATNAMMSRHDEAVGALKIEQQQSRDDRMNMRERIASNYSAIEALQDELQQERLAVMSVLHANERAAAERDAVTRVELAGIKERLNIEGIVQSVVRNMKVVA